MSRELERRLSALERAQNPGGTSYVILCRDLTEQEKANYQTNGMLPSDALATNGEPLTEAEWLCKCGGWEQRPPA